MEQDDPKQTEKGATQRGKGRGVEIEGKRETARRTEEPNRNHCTIAIDNVSNGRFLPADALKPS